MPDITQVIIWEGQAFLLALLVIVALRILTGSIRTRGLIEGTTAAGSRFVSAGRAQLLIATLVAAAQYLSQAVNDSHNLPEIPQNWLLLLGGSNLLYLGTKFHGRRNKRFYV